MRRQRNFGISFRINLDIALKIKSRLDIFEANKTFLLVKSLMKLSVLCMTREKMGA